MAVKVGMPNLRHTMESGKVVEWLVPVGTQVARGALVAVVESDKVSMEVEAPASGTLLAHLVELQSEVPVGATIALIGAPGEDVASAASPTQSPTPAAAAPPSEDALRAAPRGAVPEGRLRILASPLARDAAMRVGIPLEGIPGSGPDGLVVRADVERAASEVGSPGIRKVPLTPSRRRIADRMARAWREIPMVPLLRTLDVAALAEARARMGSPSWTALLARAVALALPAHPRLNAWMLGDAIREPATVDLGIAVALDDDLSVPVVRGADRLALRELAAEIDRLAAAARAGTLAGDAQADATFTISNLGGLGIDSFQPIVNPPQVAILGLGRVRSIEGRQAISATLVFDHRALDGAAGARFLAELDQRLGAPDALFD